MIHILKSYSGIIKSYEIKRYRQYGSAYEFIAIVHFIDDSTLHVRDYLFLDGSRKYAYHWQDKTNHLLYRWDNAEHYPHLPNFPHHCHTPDGIQPSPPMSLHKALERIKEMLSP